MTIELGFAELTLGDSRFGIIDVPGHERFIRTMVAGATGIDIALLVVAADDSVMPQTMEHLEILHLLGVRHAVVALTKIDAVDAETSAMAAEDIRALLAGSPLSEVPVCPVSSVTGQGMEALKDALRAVAECISLPQEAKPFRLAIDRVFNIPGRGTVVTGSTLCGEAAVGDVLELQPAGLACRVRGLQSHGQPCDLVRRGQRAAINLAGIDREQVERGGELATPGFLNPSRMMEARVTLLASARHSMKSAATFRLNIGTRDLPVRVVLIDRAILNPGESAYAQLRSGDPLIGVYGQRFILRSEATGRTVGGGTVLIPDARRKKRDAGASAGILHALEAGDSSCRLEQVLRLAGFARPTDLELCAKAGVNLDEIPALTNQLRAERRWIALLGSERFATPAAVNDLTERLVAWIERFHRAHPEEPGRKKDAVLGWLERVAGRNEARPILEELVRRKKLKTLGRFVCSPAFAPTLSAADEKLLHAVIEDIRRGAFQPPTSDALPSAAGVEKKRVDRLLTLAAALGELVLIEPDMYLHAEFEKRLRETVADRIRRHGPATVAEIRETLQSTRKYAVPFAEYLDKIGWTRRVGDRRVLAADIPSVSVPNVPPTDANHGP